MTQLSESTSAARDSAGEHSSSESGEPSDREFEGDFVTAMRGFFAAPFAQVPDDLYARVEPGAATRQRTSAIVQPHSRLSTNAYFGRFPASYWQRWTDVVEIVLEATVGGTGAVSVVASDSDGRSRVVLERWCVAARDQVVTFHVPVDRFVDGGALWLEAATNEEVLSVGDVRWLVPDPDRHRATAVVLCTHDRPEDCLSTLRTLGCDVDVLRAVGTVYVVDQGEDAVAARSGFAPVREMFGTALRYFRQPNMGGAGGFTRGLFEVIGGEIDGEVTNVVFMDDDILLEPDTVLRLAAFANSTVESVIVGTQMLQLLHPDRLHVSAETARFTSVEPGLPVSGALDRVDLTEQNQDLRVDADYNAWWCCLVPTEIVAQVGYPLPTFFQWDDVEFGYRCRARGHATVTLPGAAVWHADFDWKDEDEWIRYFTLRNALIIDALHGDFRPRDSARVVLRWFAECLVALRYGETATLLKAVDDFLTGPAVLEDGGSATTAEIGALRSEYPETQRQPASSAHAMVSAERPIVKAGARPSREIAVLAKRAAWQLLGRTRGRASIAAGDAKWWHVGLFEVAVVTDASQEAVRIRRLDRPRMLRLGAESVRAALRLWRRGGQAGRRWRHAHARLSSRENWARLFREPVSEESEVGSLR